MKMRHALAAALLLVGCDEPQTPEPQTPQEMYERVKQLLQPNVEHDASDYAEAMVWLRKAAEGGLVQAQTDLGGIYLEGGKEGIRANGQEAYRWFSQAAAQGSKEALYYMGLILQRGMDMPKDADKALEHWREAAAAGVAEAQFALGMTLAVTQENTREGVEWITKAAGASAPKLAAQAACALGNIYATGRPGLPRNMAEAARWYELAAQGGDAAAQLVYAIMLLEGNPVPQDTTQGMSYLRLSAGQDNPQAIALLINLLRNGGGGEQAEQEAEAWATRLETLRTPSPAPAATEAQSAHS